MNNRNVLDGFFWSALETYSTQGIAFIVGIIMARVLTPEDYGVLGIIGVFLILSETFIDSGFTNALINKDNCTSRDYNTVFIFNIIISIVLFIVLYISAPIIATFYNNQILIWTTRAMALSFVISSFGSVHMTIVTKNLNFKVKAIISLVVSISSGAIGISLAYSGWGVWSLIWQAILSVLIKVCIYICYVKWRPAMLFSKESFKELFGFGSKLLGSNLLFSLYNNLYSLVIGKVFSATELGYFTRADGYSKLIPNNISGILGKMLFPVLSKSKENDSDLCILHNKITMTSTFFIFPGCLFLAGLSSPLIFLLISQKWMPIVPILQILCIGGLFEHFCTINSNFILAKGRSEIFLKNHLVTKPVGIIIIVISVLGNIEIIAWGKVLYTLICAIVSTNALLKVINIDLKSYFGDTTKILLISIVISILLNTIFTYVNYSWINLITFLASAILLYIILTLIFCQQIATSSINLLKGYIRK